VRVLGDDVALGELLDDVAVEAEDHAHLRKLAGVDVPLAQDAVKVMRAGLSVGLPVVDIAGPAVTF